MDDLLKLSGVFIYRNARPLELARWQYHIEQGSREAVLTALGAYQNEDGGFSHALEPDCWNPASSPIQTWSATQLLREIGCFDAGLPLVAGLLRYLSSGDSFDGHTWNNTIPSNNDHPRAPWWTYAPQADAPLSYNPTAALIGYLLRAAPEGSQTRQLAQRLAREAISHLLAHPNQPMHTLHCFVQLLEDMSATDEAPALRNTLYEVLRPLVKAAIEPDIKRWDSAYVCKPSLLILSRRSPFYPDNKALVQAECAFIRRSQQPDGTWPLTWAWPDYPEAWALSRHWWLGHGIITNLCYLREMEE